MYRPHPRTLFDVATRLLQLSPTLAHEGGTASTIAGLARTGLGMRALTAKTDLHMPLLVTTPDVTAPRAGFTNAVKLSVGLERRSLKLAAEWGQGRQVGNTCVSPKMRELLLWLVIHRYRQN